LSCSGENNFGYIEIKDDKVVSYTGSPEDPEIHKFCNDEFVQSMKLLNLVKTWKDEAEERLKGGMGDSADELDWFLLDKLLKETEKDAI